MNRRTSLLRAGVTSVAGLGGIGVSALVVLGLCVIPLPVIASTPASSEVVPSAASAIRVCPGPLLTLQTRDDDATSFVATQIPETIVSAGGFSADETFLSSPDLVGEDRTLTPRAISVEPTSPDEEVLLSGAQSQLVFADDMSGLAAAACLEPEAESWLVGGATDVGQSSILNLANASQSDAAVRVEVFGENGRVDSTGFNDVIVPAGAQRLITLAALAPDLIMPVVRVTSSGGSIVATLQQTLVRTIVPSGVEIVEPGAPPNTTQVITGVRLRGTSEFADSEGGAVTSDQEPTVRVLATTSEPSDVVVSAVATDGTVAQVKATVRAGVVLQLPFNAMTDGMYTVIVTGTTPVVAAVRTVIPAGVDPVVNTPDLLTTPAPSTAPPSASANPSASPVPTSSAAASTSSPATAPTATDEQGVPAEVGPFGDASGEFGATNDGGDFAWFASTIPLGATTLFSVSPAPVAELTIFNESADAKQAMLSRQGQSDRNLELPPGRFVVVELEPNVSYQMEADSQLRATVTYSGLGLASSATVRPPSRLGSAILVYPR